MGRLLTLLVVLSGLAMPVWAQTFSGLARIDADETRLVDGPRKSILIDLKLSQGIPFRLFTLDEPRRLILDFQEVDWTGLETDTFVQSDSILSVKFGKYVPGWSRMVLELAESYEVALAAMDVDEVSGAAKLGLELKPVDAAVFAATAGAPYDPRWDLPDATELPVVEKRGADAPLVIMLDPGHGGIDPGAQSGGVVEKDLMLSFARELRELLLRSGGFEVVMTRDADYFVSLERRVALAHEVEADAFLSLHADSLAEGLAHGATIYLLSDEASDIASAKLAERHDRDDLLSGVDLSDADDQVTDILLDLARQETQPRTKVMANALVDGMTQQGGPMNRRPLRSASFSVLKAADIPSVLIEIGFLSSPRDLKNLQDPEWRAAMAVGIRNGLVNWRKADLEQRALVRQ